MVEGRSVVVRLVQKALFPTLLLGPLLLGWSLAEAGWSHVFAVIAASSTAIVPILVLQRVLPCSTQWRGRPKDFGLDMLHALVTSAIGDLWRAVTFGLAFGVSAWLTHTLGASLWPSGWPLLAQFGLALVLGDLGQYWIHRAFHEVSWLWPVHAMHHSSERLYVFSATRTHPFNFVLVYAAQMTPLILLGCSMDVLFLVSLFTAVHGMLQHANIAFDHGILNRVFATADLHRWHHSASYEESNANYGSNLILWDTLFGTRFLPEDRAHPDRMGIDGTALPENWWVHLASPFTLKRYSAALAEFDELEDFTLEAALSPATSGASELPAPTRELRADG